MRCTGWIVACTNLFKPHSAFLLGQVLGIYAACGGYASEGIDLASRLALEIFFGIDVDTPLAVA